MEDWEKAWINEPLVDPEERLPDVWEVNRRTENTRAIWNDSQPSWWNMKGRPTATIVRFHNVGVESAVTWTIYMRLERDPSDWSLWTRNHGIFHRDGFLNLVRKRIAVINRQLQGPTGINPKGPELAALAHSLVIAIYEARSLQIQTSVHFTVTAGNVPQTVRDLLGVDQELEI